MSNINLIRDITYDSINESTLWTGNQREVFKDNDRSYIKLWSSTNSSWARYQRQTLSTVEPGEYKATAFLKKNTEKNPKIAWRFDHKGVDVGYSLSVIVDSYTWKKYEFPIYISKATWENEPFVIFVPLNNIAISAETAIDVAEIRLERDGDKVGYLDNNGVTYLWNKIKALFNKGITNLSANGRNITITKGDGTTSTITTQDTTYSNFKGATASADGGNGLVPAPTKGNEGKYLKADGTWGTPTNTTYADMKGATSSAAGTHGLVPAPAAGKQMQYLRGDGTWSTPANTTYSDATQSAHGLMSVDDKKKLDGIADGANKYVHPTTSGNKHIPSGGSAGQFLKWSADGTAVWANDNNTTYSPFKGATGEADGGSGLVPAPAKGQSGALLLGSGKWATVSTAVEGGSGKNLSMTLTEKDGTQFPIANWFIGEANAGESGLMTADDKVKLGGIAEGANKYIHPTTSGNKHIPSGGSAGQFLKWSADGTAVWGNDNNTTYSDATQSAHGLMSVNDKKKLDAYPAYSTIQGTYATKAEITNMYKYCGSATSADKLPTTGQRVGDVYNIETASKYGGAGMNVAWNGTDWDPLGEIFTITAITNAEIDAICV